MILLARSRLHLPRAARAHHRTQFLHLAVLLVADLSHVGHLLVSKIARNLHLVHGRALVAPS